MFRSLRNRLLLIVGAASLALLASLVAGSVSSARQARELRDMEGRLVPKLELGPKLQSEFDRLRQTMQDAVAAQDSAALEATLADRNHIIELIGSTRGAMDQNEAALLRWTLHDYYETAHGVSQRLISGETGESLVDDMARMQAQQTKLNALIERATGLSGGEFSASFATIAAASQRADQLRIFVGLAGLVLVLALSLSASHSVLSAMYALSAGLSRFATGDFSQSISTSGLQELSKLASEANHMAADLRALAEQRDKHDWLRETQALLSNEMRGEADPTLIAERLVRCFAQRTNAVGAALYLLEGGVLRRRGQYARGAEGPNEGEPASLAGSGLLAEALRADSAFVVKDVPVGYFTVQSGLGSAAPATLVFLPLSRLGDHIGVLELALFGADTDRVVELLSSVQEMVVIGLQVARSRAALERALKQTQEQADRLTAQEEELRSNNQELQSQHEELRVANAGLEAQRETLGQQNAELEEARHRLQQKAEELTKMSTYKSQFLANMSHELRTPLNSMLLLSHLLAQNEAGNLTAKQVEYCKTVHAAGGDLLNLINQVLDLAKIESGKQELQLETVELGRFTDYARRIFQALAEEKHLKLTTEVAEGSPSVMVTDPQRVERVITNLLGNAIKFTEAGKVALRFYQPAPGTPFTRPTLDASSCIALEVSDTGIGIAASAHERVFAPFEQIDSRSVRRYAGTGLGLAISRESVNLLGGELRLESEPGRGSKFTCFLPLTSVDETRGVARPSELSQVADDRAQVDDETPHLLVIEDDPVLGEQLADIIRARRLKVVVA
ncbi:MAG: ATP-binding protein, partial [Polyangiaceae bacterium]